jgi:biopolymer transport protein ExbB
MIETFRSLAEMSLFSAGGGGIAGGISEALFSTQMGLVVAVPGLLLGRMLDRREELVRAELHKLRDWLLQGARP